MKPDTGGTRPIIDTLRHLDGGRFLDDLSAEQKRIVEACLETNAPGKLTIELKFAVEGRAQIAVRGTVKRAVPELPRGKSIFFAAEDGTLLRNPPGQDDMFEDDRFDRGRGAG